MSSKKKPKEPIAPVMPDQILDEPIPVQPEENEPISGPIDTPRSEGPAGPNPAAEEVSPKYPIGSIVFVTKDADADLNGFKLFPQYKKYTYTVEAYDAENKVYSLRRLNLSLKLKEANIVAPSERETSPLARKQY